MDSSATLKPPNHIVVAGGANLDILGRSAGPLSRGDSTPGGVLLAPGGVARNVAENLARLGHKVHLISAVGDDETGRRLLQDTAAAGVNVEAVFCFPGLGTARYVALCGPDGALAMAVNDMRVLDSLSPNRLAAHESLLKSASVLVLDCNLPEAALEWFFESAHQAKAFVDGVSAAKCTRLRPWLGNIHTLKLNRLEAGALTGQAVTTLAEAAAATAFLQGAGVQNVVISLGEAGVCWRGEDAVFGHRVARAVVVRNSNGAGDALLAGLVHGHTLATNLADAVAWGAACAQMTLTSESANASGLTGLALTEHLQGVW